LVGLVAVERRRNKQISRLRQDHGCLSVIREPAVDGFAIQLLECLLDVRELLLLAISGRRAAGRLGCVVSLY